MDPVLGALLISGIRTIAAAARAASVKQEEIEAAIDEAYSEKQKRPANELPDV